MFISIHEESCQSAVVLSQLANLSLKLSSYFTVVQPLGLVSGLYCHMAYMQHYFNLYFREGKHVVWNVWLHDVVFFGPTLSILFLHPSCWPALPTSHTSPPARPLVPPHPLLQPTESPFCSECLCLLSVKALVFFAVSNKGPKSHRACCCRCFNTAVSIYSEGISGPFFLSV